MERRARIALFAVLSAIAAVLIAVIVSSKQEPPSSPTPVGKVAPAPSAEPRPAPGLREASGAHREDHGVGETPPALAVIEASRAGRAEAEPVVDRFLSAFGDYELGRLTPEVRADIRATATRDFARELLAEPPRIPLGEADPVRAEVVKVEIYLAPDASEGTANATLERRGSRTRTTFLLRRRDGGWRVSGLL